MERVPVKRLYLRIMSSAVKATAIMMTAMTMMMVMVTTTAMMMMIMKGIWTAFRESAICEIYTEHA